VSEKDGLVSGASRIFHWVIS